MSTAELIAAVAAVPREEVSLVLNACVARLAAPEPAATPEPMATPLTQEEAADRYRIPLRTLRRLTRVGIVPSYPQGRNRMLCPADLETYLRRCRAQGVRVGTRLDV